MHHVVETFLPGEAELSRSLRVCHLRFLLPWNPKFTCPLTVKVGIDGILPASITDRHLHLVHLRFWSTGDIGLLESLIKLC